MRQDLIAGLAPQVKRLGNGGYGRAYVDARGIRRDSPLHLLVAELLETLGVRYKTDVKAFPSSRLTADFSFGDTLIFLDKKIPLSVQKALVGGKKLILIERDSFRSDRLDPGVRVIELGGEQETGQQMIFLDDPSFNFDYAHILPKTQKCSVMHGHTSSVLVEIIGRPVEGMVVDFGPAKDAVRAAIRGLDHKLFIRKRYVTDESKTHVKLSFATVHGDFRMEVPKATTVLLEGEATVENLSREVLSRIVPAMPKNVSAVGVYVYEGMNKGSHILAQLHRDQGDGKRRAR
jgi:6-pyruvoyltetrahydropterin/6-carboxytetrahydropterin synthase